MALARIDALEKLLQQLCPNVRVNRDSGKVELIDPQGDMSSPACCCLSYLLSARCLYNVFLFGKDAGDSVSLGSQIKMADAGGGTIQFGANATMRESPSDPDRLISGIGSNSVVTIDVSNNDGRGYFVYDAQGRPISYPPFIILAHLLTTGTAYHAARGTLEPTAAGRTKQAIDHENDIRRSTNAPNGRPYATRADDRVGRVGTAGVTTAPPDNHGG
jgi:hypothetical protein